MSIPWSRRLIIQTSVLVTSVVLFGGLAELLVRVRAQIRYGSGFFRIEDIYRDDPALGVRELVPGSSAGRIRVNSLGFRGPEIANPKPERTTRIAFLGGSTTFCAEVSSDEAAWPAVTVDLLRRRLPQRDFDYINAGVPGYTIDNSLRAFRARVERNQPDIVVIYHASNDLSHYSALAAARQHIDVTYLHDRGMTWVGRYSLLWYLVEKNLRIWRLQRAALGGGQDFVPDIAELTQPFERDLRALVAATREVAPTVAVATFSIHIRPGQSAEEQVDAAGSTLYYMPHMTPAVLLESFAAYNQAIRRVADDFGLILVEAETAIPGDYAHFVDTVHFTDQGSRRMAELVADALVTAAEARGRDTGT